MTEAHSSWRTANVLRQLKGSIGYRAVAMVLSLLTLPMMIGVLGTEQFGVWSTLLSIMSWAVFFDLGIGNGLRNKVAAALANDNKTEARLYIGSGYTIIGLVVAALWVVLTTSSYFVPWQVVFNTTAISENELRQTFQIMVFFVLINFWIGLVAALFSAVQQTSFVELGRMTANFLVMIFVFVLMKTEASSIKGIAILYGTALVFANLLLSALFFKQRSDLRPTIHLNVEHIRPLLTLGSQFFLIQLAVLVIFTTDKILITQIFGAEYVTEYDVIFKIFSLVTISHGLILAPLWSAYTDAYKKDELVWINTMLSRQLRIFCGFTVATLILTLLLKPILALWVGDSIQVNYSLGVAMALFCLVSAWNNIFATVLNGVNKIKISVYVSAIAMLCNIPLSIALAKYTSLGTASVVIGTIFSLLPGVLLGPVQVVKIMTKRDRGLWSR